MNTGTLTKMYEEALAKARKAFANDMAIKWWTRTIIPILFIAIAVLLTGEPLVESVLHFMGYTLWGIVAVFAIGFSLGSSMKGWSWLVAVVAGMILFVWNAGMTLLAYLALTSGFAAIGTIMLLVGALVLCPIPMFFLGKERGLRTYSAPVSLELFLKTAEEMQARHTEMLVKDHDEDAHARRGELIFVELTKLVDEKALAEITKMTPLWNELETIPETVLYASFERIMRNALISLEKEETTE